MGDDQFAKLSEQLDKRFVQIDERFANMDELITKLYQHMADEFSKVHEELAKKADRDQVDRLYNPEKFALGTGRQVRPGRRYEMDRGTVNVRSQAG